MAEIDIFDGHNDAVQFIAEYTSSGRDFLVRSESGHLDLARAREGGLIGDRGCERPAASVRSDAQKRLRQREPVEIRLRELAARVRPDLEE